MAWYYFTAIDYCIMAFSMISFIGIGLYYRFSGGRQKTTEEYLMANRELAILPVSLSLMTSFISAISILGTTGEFYSRGSMFLLAHAVAVIISPVGLFAYLPVFFKLQKVSTYEYLELRFGPKLRLTTSLMYTVQTILFNGVVLYAPAITLQAIADLSKVTSILLTGFVCMFYSTIGGIKAIVVTDLLQAFIMVASAMSIIIFAALEVGGFGDIFKIAYQHERLSFNNFSFDPTIRHTWFSLLVGGSFNSLAVSTVGHIRVQRLLTVRTLKQAQLSGLLSTFFLFVFTVAMWVTGLAMFAVYSDCDPVANGKVKNSEQLVPYFVVTSMQGIPGLAGLFVAGIFSATLSNLSAASNGLAGLVTRDYMPYIERRLNNRSLSGPIANKVSAFVAGFLFIAVAFVTEYLGGLFQAVMSILNAFGGPILGVFTLGMFTTTANEKGTIIGLIAGLALTSWKSFGGPRPPIKSLPVLTEGCSNATLHRLASVAATMTTPKPDSDYFYLYRLSYLWISCIGLFTVLFVGYIASRLIKQKHPWEISKKDTSTKSSGLADPLLFTPLFGMSQGVRRRNEEILTERQWQYELMPLTTGNQS